MKILVVDDEALLVKGIRFNLQNEGYDVITGSDGLEAVQAVQEQQPDLVVLDVMMPNMDGLTACAKIREFSDIPIIMLTAKTDDMDKLIGFDHGADDYLTKPFNILELKARIRALLRRAGSAEKKAPCRSLTIGTITVDKEKMPVPKYYYIALLKVKNSVYSSIAFWVEHREYDKNLLLKSDNDEVMAHAISVDELEDRTGIDFFCNLPGILERQVESTYMTAAWKN